MDLRHLETFVKIAELKSFTKAAEKLHLTQPTVSKQIVDLEQYFGIRLIDRTKRSFALTKAGDIVLRYAMDFAVLKKELTSTIDDLKGLQKGIIYIGASNIPGIYILPRALNTFRKLYQGIHIHLSVTDTRDTISKVEEGLIDIGFVGAKIDAKAIDYRKFFEDMIVLVAPTEYPDSITATQIKDYPFITREIGSGTRNVFEKTLKDKIQTSPAMLNVTAELADTEAIKQAVKSGMGISYISRMAVEEENHRGTLKILTVKGFPEIRRSIYMITRKGKTLLPQVKAFIETIEKWRKHERS